ncbi:NAD-dependent epimerase/dehydratase family protein [Nitrosopumilus sp. b2]|uniref:NAD-dependent epimerase/dehydratase family protein n=1 Tax=Nitrosopumilus sp. b2 TaxID=2109908 RepID=UPI0015F63FEB|nr:NAD-dependent epimerase/dehydratase family protein [Nitrosopumilus sp. b2]KAF6245787.1 hypothetical protein C6989_01230 [Nitrosopumilus sp. b2]
MTIIILGSSGFLGRALISKLELKKIKFKGMVKQKNKIKRKYFFGDITKENFLEKHISDNDIIINLIGQNNKDTSKLFEQNVKGAFNLLNSIIKKKNIKVIFASTIMLYNENVKNPSKESDTINPTTNYQIVKALTENIYHFYSKIFGIDVTVLRFSNVYGPNKKTGIISNCLKSIKKNKPITIDHNGNQVRDFLYIDDAIESIIKSISSHTKGYNLLNISSGTGIQIKKIIGMIEDVSKKKIPVNFTSEKFDKKNLVANNIKAKKLIKFTPKTDIHEGLGQTILSRK